MTLYRCLQLFCILVNDFNGSVLTVGFVLMTGITSVTFIYPSLTCSYLSLFVFLLLPLIAAFCIVVILFFIPQHAKVRILSKDLVALMGKRPLRMTSYMWDDESTGYLRCDTNCNLRSNWLTLKARALAPLGIHIWYFGVFTLATSEELLQQIFTNVLLFLSL